MIARSCAWANRWAGAYWHPSGSGEAVAAGFAAAGEAGALVGAGAATDGAGVVEGAAEAVVGAGWLIGGAGAEVGGGATAGVGRALRPGILHAVNSRIAVTRDATTPIHASRLGNSLPLNSARSGCR